MIFFLGPQHTENRMWRTVRKRRRFEREAEAGQTGKHCALRTVKTEGVVVGSQQSDEKEEGVKKAPCACRWELLSPLSTL